METKNSSSWRGIRVISVNVSEILINGKESLVRLSEEFEFLSRVRVVEGWFIVFKSKLFSVLQNTFLVFYSSYLPRSDLKY